MPDYTVFTADCEDALWEVRGLFVEYRAVLGVEECFGGFSEELEGLPGVYAPPRGRLFYACADDDPMGCVALRPDSDRPDVGEVKRLFVRSTHQGRGIGRALMEAVLAVAGDCGYSTLRLNVPEGQAAARALYTALGFEALPAPEGAAILPMRRSIGVSKRSA